VTKLSGFILLTATSSSGIQREIIVTVQGKKFVTQKQHGAKRVHTFCIFLACSIAGTTGDVGTAWH